MRGQYNLRFIFSLVGYVVILLGTFLLRQDWFFTNFFGSLILVVGYQIVLWAIEVQSEMFGNKVTDIIDD